MNAISPVGVRSHFNFPFIKYLTDDTLLPLFVSPVLLKGLHPHDISLSQRLKISGMAIVIPRLSPFAVLNGRVLTISQFQHQQAGGCGAPIHQVLSLAVSSTLFRCVAVVQDSQVDISFCFLRSCRPQCPCWHVFVKEVCNVLRSKSVQRLVHLDE